MYLSYDDRKQIEKLYADNMRIEDIAKYIGVHRTAMYREVKRGRLNELDKNGRWAYDAETAQKNVKTHKQNIR